MPRFRIARAALTLGLSVVAVASVRAAEIWRSDWYAPAPPTLARTFAQTPAPATFASNGDILLGTFSYSWSGNQFVRFGPDGSLRWSANANWSSGSIAGATAMVATDDGGALVAVGVPEYVARIDASGQFVWMRSVPAAALTQVGADRIAVDDCYRGMMLLDETSGDVIWQQVDSNFPMCESGDIAADDSGGIYSLAIDATSLRLLKHDENDGSLTWNVVIGTSNQSAVIVGASAGQLYVYSNVLDAINTSDGSLAWSASFDSQSSILLAGSPAEPIVVSPTSISRLAADTGAPRWTTALTSHGTGSPLDDSILVSTPGGVARVTVADGAIAWSTALPSQDSYGNGLSYFAFGGLANGQFSAVAKPYSSAPVPAFVETVSFADGTAGGSVDLPAVAQGPWGVSRTDGAGRVLGAQSAWSSGQPAAGVRALDAGTGKTAWEVSTPIDLTIFAPDTPTNFSADIGSTPTTAIVAVTASESSYTTSLGELWLALYDSATGVARWQTVLRDPDQGTTNASTPVADAQGDVYVDIGASYYCGESDGCSRRTLRKVSAADGHELWHFENDAPDADDPFEQTFALAGDDAIVAGPFSGALSEHSVIALSQSDGATHWTSDVLGAGGVSNVLPGNDGILVVGAGWAKLDPATGNAVWQGPVFAPACTIGCYSYDIAKLPDDDIVMAGEADRHPLVTMLRGDGSGSYANWDLAPNAPSIRSVATFVKAGQDGRVWIGLLRQAMPSGAGLSALAEIDPATGALLSQQTLRARAVDLLQSNMTYAPISAPTSNRLLVEEQTAAPPAATPSGNVLLDTTITAHGDLVATLDFDRDFARPGQAVAFHARMTYTGDAPIAGAQLNVYLPWPTGARDVVCSGVDPCALDTRGGNVLATVDLAPGDVVDITGTVLATYERYVESVTAGAVAIGPVGLDESDTLNNIAQRAVSEGLFADGFDGN